MEYTVCGCMCALLLDVTKSYNSRKYMCWCVRVYTRKKIIKIVLYRRTLRSMIISQIWIYFDINKYNLREMLIYFNIEIRSPRCAMMDKYFTIGYTRLVNHRCCTIYGKKNSACFKKKLINKITKLWIKINQMFTVYIGI